MPKPDVELEQTYAVGGKDVRLSITIGEGQLGMSSVSLGTQLLVKASDTIGGLLLGSGSDLIDEELRVDTVVTDVSSLTNRMSVTYRLEGGKARKAWLAKGKVTSAFDTLFFRATFSFTK